LALAVSLSVVAGGCTSTTAKPPTQQNFLDKVGSSIKSGTSKVAAAVTPKPQLPDTTVAAPSGKPGPNVFVAVAQMHERSGDFDEAEASYRKALELDAKHLEALIGFARLEDRRSNFEAATRLYQRAIKLHPKEASAHNDLGLCYHRRGKLPEATRELKRAVELEGENKLYRNNLAAVYVEQGQEQNALAQLTAAHGNSVAHYNLGYLLMQKQKQGAALEQFQLAAQMDPNLIAAQQWVAKLSATSPYASQVGATQVVHTPRPQYQPAQPQYQPAQPQYQAAQPQYVAQRVPPQPSQPAQYAPAGQAHVSNYGPAPSGAYQQAPRQADPVPPMPSQY
jgi:tetratricopeptide (TPR) repeat protein